MSKLDELIKELCPDGVEYKELNSVCRFQNGFSFKSPLFKSSGLPILRITNISNGEIKDSDFVYFEKSDYKEDLSNYEVKKGDVVVAMSGATTGKIGYNYSNNTYYLNQRVGLFVPNENKLSKRYLFHWLTSQSNNILNISSGSGAQPNLSSVKMMEFIIPIPPLPVQEEIVRILDKFTSLTAELTAELTARRKQYEYYRDSLLTRETKVEIKKLGELCQQISNIKWKNEKNSFQYIDLTSVDRETHEIINPTKIDSSNAPSRAQQIVKENDVLFGTTRPMLKRSTFISKEFDGQICSTGYCVLRPNQEIVKPRYIYHHINSSLFYQYVETHQQGASYPAISDADIKNFAIPLPPLDIQQRIVNVLDNFDAICSDLKIGLPAEIDARKKQYEYYRDLLLTFAERGNTIFTEQNRTEQNRTEQNRTEQMR